MPDLVPISLFLQRLMPAWSAIGVTRCNHRPIKELKVTRVSFTRLVGMQIGIPV